MLSTLSVQASDEERRVLHCTILYCTVLYCTHTVLYYTTLLLYSYLTIRITSLQVLRKLINTNNDKKISLQEWESFMSSTEAPPADAATGPPISPTPMKKKRQDKPIPEEVAML
jgi:hypothetical protein